MENEHAPLAALEAKPNSPLPSDAAAAPIPTAIASNWVKPRGLLLQYLGFAAEANRKKRLDQPVKLHSWGRANLN